MASVAAELEGSAQRERELRKVVLAWLNKKGYARAEEQFRKEAEIAGDVTRLRACLCASPCPFLRWRADDTFCTARHFCARVGAASFPAESCRCWLAGDESLSQFAFRRGLENDFCVKNYILQWGMEDTKPSRYGESYAELREWILKLLDDLKNELSELLYPLLVHCYLELVSKQYTAEARDLLAKYRQEHEPEFYEELTALASAVDASQLDNCPVASRYLHEAKTKVYLCHESDRLLTEFLHNKRLHIMVRLLNQYMDVVIYGNTVHDMAPQMPVPRSLEEEQAAVKRPPIRFGMLAEESVKRRRRPGEADGGAKDAAGVVKKEEGADAMDVEGDGDVELRDLPQLGHETEQQILADLSKRVAVSSGALPSVCCYTIFNAKEMVHSIDISQDASVVAVGMSNSRVKIWRSGSGGDPAAPDRGGDGTGAGAVAGGAGSQQGMVGHGGPVFSTAVSPDNRFVLSASEDKTARLWCASSQLNLVTYRGHNYPVWDVSWSALGHYFATCSHDRTARLWSTDHIYPLRIFAGHLSSVDCVTFHPNCNYIATGSCDRTCRLWDMAMGECVRLFKGHRAPVTATAISSCGKLLVSGADNGEMILWDLATSKSLCVLSGHAGAVHSVDFSCGGAGLLASSGADGTVRLWDVSTNSPGSAGSAGSAGVIKTEAGSDKLEVKPETLCLNTRGNMPMMRVRFSRTNLLLAAGTHSPTPKD